MPEITHAEFLVKKVESRPNGSGPQGQDIKPEATPQEKICNNSSRLEREIEQ